MLVVRKGADPFKADNNIKNPLVAPVNRGNITQKSRVIFRYNCDQVDCEEECIGHSARNFRERQKRHLRVPSPSYDRGNTAGQHISVDNFSIVVREAHIIMRTTKEAM